MSSVLDALNKEHSRVSQVQAAIRNRIDNQSNLNAQLDSELAMLPQNVESAKNQRLGMDAILTEQREALLKESKSINNANLNKLKGFASKNPNDRVSSFILDNITRFLSADARTKYHAPYFANEVEIQAAIKNADYGSLDKVAIEAIMVRLLPGVDGEGGDIL